MVRDTFEKEGLAIVVACGRDTIPYASSVRCLAPDNVFVIQIQHPRYRLDRFDLVVTPRHDYYALTAKGQQEVPWLFRRWITPREPPGPNVAQFFAKSCHTCGGHFVSHTFCGSHTLPKEFHCYTAFFFLQNHETKQDKLFLFASDHVSHNLIVEFKLDCMLIETGHGNCNYGVDLAKQLVSSLHNVSETCGSVRISFSRRTPQKVSDLILREFSTHPKFYIWGGEEPNPHLGHLAWADAFIITADSISMLSEACSTGTMSDSWSYPPLNDAIDVAARVREVLAQHGWTVG
ncbi:hypothetical protein TRIUR3_15116 [Triticum urartu]|uniref:Mitochondrial fission protein ELM1 n=1 Tax=Triticum urartu TaxID=4572 RepID=M7ZU17_TRIUA|nr:hypothetical protein TRIUR3_15116 [Triticum urartu]